MEELKDQPAEVGVEAESPEDAAGRKFRLSKRVIIFGAAGLLVLSLIVAGIFAYLSSAQQKEAAQAQQREQKARETAAKELENQQANALAKELHRTHEEVLATPSALPGIFSAPPREIVPKPVSAEKPSVPVTVIAPPPPPTAEQKAAESKPEAKAESKPSVERAVVPPKTKTAGKGAPADPRGVAAPNAAGGCALSGGKPDDYGKALGKCLEEFNRLEGRKPNVPSKTD